MTIPIHNHFHVKHLIIYQQYIYEHLQALNEHMSLNISLGAIFSL